MRTPSDLQTSLDESVARSFLYRFLAQLFDYPAPAAWQALSDAATHQGVRAAAAALAVTDGPGMVAGAEVALAMLDADHLTRFTDDYIAAFGHGARGSCPLNEIEYGDLKADPLFQPHRLADLGAFYTAFGLQLTEDGGERHDHLAVELEFMAVLALRDASALEEQRDPDELDLNRQATARFLREHLGRWTPAFVRRLVRMLPDSPLAPGARLLGALVEADCRRFGIPPGSADLLLRPVDETADSACASCGIPALPPGALAPA